LDAGVGWGGSCFGKDLSALMHTAREYGLEPVLAAAAVEVNRRQRRWLVQRLQATLKTLKGRRVAVLGLTFKPGTDDLRDSPAETVIADLTRLGARVVAHDPVATEAAAKAWSYPVDYVSRVDDAIAGAEAVLLVTAWPEYAALDWARAHEAMERSLVLDGRNLWSPDVLRRLGIEYYSVGR
jgi:UDPglucose 6-dehydrogenase